ncbi:NUDIX domain-containing protein [Mycobacterium sp. BMJ-28]
MDPRSAKSHPWRSESSRIAYSNAWISVIEHRVHRPDGTHGIYGVVATESRAITIIAIHRLRACLIREFRFPINEYVWRFPTGAMTLSESSLPAAASRELLEETGYTAQTWEVLGRIAPMSGLSNEIASVFLAKDLNRVSVQGERDISEVTFATQREINQMIRAGEVIDGQTLAALALLYSQGSWCFE